MHSQRVMPEAVFELVADTGKRLSLRTGYDLELVVPITTKARIHDIPLFSLTRQWNFLSKDEVWSTGKKAFKLLLRAKKTFDLVRKGVVRNLAPGTAIQGSC